MKNYQKLYYEKYYVLNEKGDLELVTRSTCFAPGEKPTTKNPFKQRWFYDPEGKTAICLERSKQSEDMHRMNANSLKKEERYIKSKLKCLGKQTKDCHGNCDHCDKYISCTLELDKPLGNEDEDNSDNYIDLPSSDLTPDEILVNKEISIALKKAITRLTPKQQKLIYLRFTKNISVAEISDRWGVSRQAINKQIKTITNVLKNNLKNFK